MPSPRRRLARPARAAGLLVGIGVVIAAAAGCGSSGDAGAPVASSSARVKERAEPALEPRPMPAAEQPADEQPADEPPIPEQPTPGPTAYPDDQSAPACTEADLDVMIAGYDAAAGTRYLTLEATNTSDRACAVQGAPELGFSRLSGTKTPGVVYPALCRGLPPRVVVPADQKLYAVLEWGAMSTSLDPDVAVAMRVRATPDSSQVTLPFDEVPLYDGTTLDELDVLDGAQVEVGWWQADANVWLGCPAA